MKKFLTIDEQVEKLKSRGLVIPNDREAKLYLLTNNYYNVINGYSKPFLLNKEKYIDNASFNEVKQLYFFDKEIKEAFLKDILHVEHHVKAILAYRFEEEYKDEHNAYLNINSYDPNKSVELAKVITILNNIIQKNKRYENNAISHYEKNHKRIPLWVLGDFLNFGNLIHIIEVLPYKMKYQGI